MCPQKINTVTSRAELITHFQEALVVPKTLSHASKDLQAFLDSSLKAACEKTFALSGKKPNDPELPQRLKPKV